MQTTQFLVHDLQTQDDMTELVCDSAARRDNWRANNGTLLTHQGWRGFALGY